MSQKVSRKIRKQIDLGIKSDLGTDVIIYRNVALNNFYAYQEVKQRALIAHIASIICGLFLSLIVTSLCIIL